MRSVRQEPYTAADLNWMDTKEPQHRGDERPGLPPRHRRRRWRTWTQYDTVFVGFPIWWYVEPRIVDTFLESYDFSGKTLIPFATSGGSGIEQGGKELTGPLSPRPTGRRDSC